MIHVAYIYVRGWETVACFETPLLDIFEYVNECDWIVPGTINPDED